MALFGFVLWSGLLNSWMFMNIEIINWNVCHRTTTIVKVIKSVREFIDKIFDQS